MADQRASETAAADAQLVRHAQAGDRAAFGRLVERYQRRATGVAYRLLGDLHEALEACQESFVRAYRNLNTLHDERRFAAWLLRIVTNVSLNLRRSRAARVTRCTFDDCILERASADETLVANGRAAVERPGEQMAAGELAGLLEQAIARLPERQRVALVLFSIEQLPQKDVAEIMGCSVEAVKWHVFQARRKLREGLAEHL